MVNIVSIDSVKFRPDRGIAILIIKEAILIFKEMVREPGKNEKLSQDNSFLLRTGQLTLRRSTHFQTGL